MSKLPRISGRECVKELQKVGFYVKRQGGSHMVWNDDPFTQVVVPDHMELDRGTLGAIVKHAGMRVDEFVKLL
jgi:predicted RNA binding protein YcfA (HicA-like mRNA interferase family)